VRPSKNHSAGWFVLISKATYSSGRSIQMSVVINSPHAGTSLGVGESVSELVVLERAALERQFLRLIRPDPATPPARTRLMLNTRKDQELTDGEAGLSPWGPVADFFAINY